MRKIGLRTGVLAVALMMAAPAMAQPTTACSPSAVATSDQQVSAWDKADLVVVAQIAERLTISLPGLPDAPQATIFETVSLKALVEPRALAALKAAE